MVDTNSDPTEIDFPIPANDDASKSISLIVDILCKAVEEGLNERKIEKDKESGAKEKKITRRSPGETDLSSGSEESSADKNEDEDSDDDTSSEGSDDFNEDEMVNAVDEVDEEEDI